MLCRSWLKGRSLRRSDKSIGFCLVLRHIPRYLLIDNRSYHPAASLFSLLLNRNSLTAPRTHSSSAHRGFLKVIGELMLGLS